MSDSTIRVLSSVVAPVALVSLLSGPYTLAATTGCRLAARGMNDTYRLESETGVVYARLSPHGWRTAEELASEVDLLDDLDRAGVPVARAIRRNDGGAVTRIMAPEGERFAVLFAPAAGEDVREIGRRQARNYGRWAAAMHTVADAAVIPFTRPALDVEQLLDEPLAAIRAALPDGGEDLAFLESVAERVRRRLADLHRNGADFGLCHGDLHPGNARFSGIRMPTVFDFDCCGAGWRAYDLAVFLWNATGEGRSRRWQAERWAAFLGGYRETRSFSAEAEASVPLFLVARQIWLMGLDASGRTEWVPQWIGPGWLRRGVEPVRGWIAEYPILAG